MSFDTRNLSDSYKHLIHETLLIGGENVKFHDYVLIESNNEILISFNFSFGEEIKFSVTIPEHNLNGFDVATIHKYVDESIRELRETLKTFMLILDKELQSWVIE